MVFDRVGHKLSAHQKFVFVQNKTKHHFVQKPLMERRLAGLSPVTDSVIEALPMYLW